MEKSSLFSQASFILIKRDDFYNEDVQLIISKLVIAPAVEHFHPKRRQEFLLGRYCAYIAYRDLLGKELLSLPSHDDRAPIWPLGVVGSISHNHAYVCCAISKSNCVLGIGVDVEEMGRTKIELGRYIRVPEDIASHEAFDENALLTFIFSAKESFYKALYPQVKKFFGFEYAYVSEINFEQKTFKIQLLKNLNSQFNLLNLYQFEGRFILFGNHLITAIEILALDDKIDK